MKVKLIDVQVETEEVEFGTCELCFWVGEAGFPTFIFEKEDGTEFEIEGWHWNWGDIDTIEIDNVILFNDYISQMEFDEDTEFDDRWLFNLAFDYGEIHGRRN